MNSTEFRRAIGAAADESMFSTAILDYATLY